MTPDEARSYASQSAESDPADLRELLDALPKDPRPLLDVVAGLILDTAFVAPLRVACPPDSADDVEIRQLPEMLRRILARGPGSLATARPPEKRLIGACRPQSSRAVRSVGIAGVWFVAGSVVRDLAALNKREMLPWDYWGISRNMRPGIPVNGADAARIDTLAALIADPEPDWRTLREAYDDEAFGVPRVVMSFPRGRPIEVAVGA